MMVRFWRARVALKGASLISWPSGTIKSNWAKSVFLISSIYIFISAYIITQPAMLLDLLLLPTQFLDLLLQFGDLDCCFNWMGLALRVVTPAQRPSIGGGDKVGKSGLISYKDLCKWQKPPGVLFKPSRFYFKGHAALLAQRVQIRLFARNAGPLRY